MPSAPVLRQIDFARFNHAAKGETTQLSTLPGKVHLDRLEYGFRDRA